MLYNLIVYVVYFALLPIYRLKVKGAEKIPEGAAVVCGNHTARVDAVVLFLALFGRPSSARLSCSAIPSPGGSSLIWAHFPWIGARPT